MAADSPCIGVCRLMENEMTCAGCFRTMHEIATWHRLTETEKFQVLVAIDQRRAASARRTDTSQSD
jgi:predicted Fe-S protein YdhL (DUF1289 family)